MSNKGITMVACDGNALKSQIMELIYQAATTGDLGYLDGMDPETGEIIPLLAGVEHLEDGQIKLYPLAQLFLNPAELKDYLSPDKYGNFIQQSTRDAISACGKAKE